MKIISFILISLFIINCYKENTTTINTNTQHTYNFKSDIVELSQYIDLSKVKIDSNQSVYWNVYKLGSENSEVPGPSDYYIIASFKLQRLEMNNLNIVNILNQPLKKESQYYKDWLPGSTDFLFNDKDEKTEILVYAPNLFKKSPYINGFFCVSDNLNVYLFMYTQ